MEIKQRVTSVIGARSLICQGRGSACGKGDLMESRVDFDERPFIVIWETTQACDLACIHCRACAQPLRSALELNTEEAKRLIDEVRQLKAPVFVLTGGDPLKRPDIFELVEHASTSGVRISLTPSA